MAVLSSRADKLLSTRQKHNRYSKKNGTTFNRIHFSSKSYKWNTPREIFEELDKEFHFNFDPFVPVIVGDFKGDAFKEDWKPSKKIGRVFANPPYERGLLMKSILRGWKMLCLGKSEIIVFLIPMRNARYLKFLRSRGAEIRLADKRLKFQKQDNPELNDSAPFDSAIAILTTLHVKEYFKKHGVS